MEYSLHLCLRIQFVIIHRLSFGRFFCIHLCFHADHILLWLRHTSCHYYWIIQGTRGIVAMYILSSTISWLTCDNVLLYIEQVKWMCLCVSMTHHTPLTAIGNNVSMAWRQYNTAREQQIA